MINDEEDDERVMDCMIYSNYDFDGKDVLNVVDDEGASVKLMEDLNARTVVTVRGSEEKYEKFSDDDESGSVGIIIDIADAIDWENVIIATACNMMVVDWDEKIDYLCEIDTDILNRVDEYIVSCHTIEDCDKVKDYFDENDYELCSVDEYDDGCCKKVYKFERGDSV